MKIGYVLRNFPALSETFIRREIMALCQAGHQVSVYTNYRHRDPLVSEPMDSMLIVRQIPFLRNLSALIQAAEKDYIEHLHSSLMIDAHNAAYAAAKELQITFTLTAYSGYDIFTSKDSNLYHDISKDSLCEAIIVEDPFMQDWVINHLGADSNKIAIISNSIDLNLYCLNKPRKPHERIVILAIARFVEKKGLIPLIHAFNNLCNEFNNVELWLVGSGPEEPNLRHASRQNKQIEFMGLMTESQTQEIYHDADIFCLPCVRTAEGDADGIPTTILEAMAFELPVVTSDLLSAPYYVRDQKEGLLTPPGNVEVIATALKKLCADKKLRQKLGIAGRTRVTELCDLKKNIKKLEAIMINGRKRRWRNSLDILIENRKHYTKERKKRYSNNREHFVKEFKPWGRILDIGCGQGDFRFHLSPGATYFGCDPHLNNDSIEGNFPFTVALGEALPYSNEAFDSVVIYNTLEYVFNVDQVIAEAKRVLRPGGLLYLRVCINDSNPNHLNHFTETNLQQTVSKALKIMDSIHNGSHLLLIKARKPLVLKSRTREPYPLVSIAITVFNREKYIRQCIESTLKQSYKPIEVVVVDDGSTDGTQSTLEEFGNKIRVAINNTNRGIAYVKNQALRMTSSEAQYVAILDSDDYLHPHFVEQCVAFLESNPDIGLVYTDDILINETDQVLRKRQSVHPWNIDEWLRTCNLRGDTWMARRQLVMSTNLHDEALTHDIDYDLFYQLLEITDFAHLQEYLVYYRHHEGQSAHNKLQLAKCHAANLVKYGYSPEYAYLRARCHPEWIPAIKEGISLGKKLRELRGK